jgi:glycosyltransferase involved in cell wall biosynthesis
MHITDRFDPRFGYAEFYLVKKQKELGFDISVVTSDRDICGERKWSSFSTTVRGIDIYIIESLFEARGIVWPLRPLRLAKMINSFSPDVVHCHGFLNPLTQEALLLKNFYKYKVVGDLITGISPLTFILLPRFRFFFNFLVSSKVNAFFACNKAVEEFLTRNMNIPQKKVHLIPLAADHKLFKPDNSRREKTRSRLGLLPEDIVAIYTGKFLPSKRIHDLLAACKPIIDRHKYFKIVLVGDGPEHYKEKLKSIIGELGITKNVLIIKTVHRKELPNFYNAADFAVWPGAFSISIVEAMACGLPIIIAKSDWTSHYLEYENGYSFEAGDVHKLSSLLLTLVKDDKTRRLMGTKSRKLVEDKLNWDTVATKYLEVYKSIML